MPRRGDNDDFTPEWKQKVDSLKQKNLMNDPLAQDMDDHLITPEEVALRLGDSIVKINDDGCLDLFVSQTLGIRLDPTTNSISFFGENVNLFTKRLNIATQPDGFVWNGNYFNPATYYENDTEKDQYVSGDKNYWTYNDTQGWHWERQPWRYKPMIPSTGRAKYSSGMKDILKGMGLPIE